MAISPRSSKYDRLEGGMGPSRMNNKRIGWKKFALAGAAIIGFVWFFRPRESVKSHPTSFKEDPDPSKTTHCTAPYAPHLPLVQYALIIDADPLGSRIHIYKFNNCGSSPSYEYEVLKQRQPGLSNYDYIRQPNKAAASLDALLDTAIKVVPAALRSCTPVAVKSIAGLRVLPGTRGQDILDAVARRINNKYPFKLHEVVEMDGKDVGAYTWITANYLLSTIRADTPPNTPTYAVLGHGGGSTRIVFEPTFTKSDGTLEEGEHKYLLDIGGKKHTLYQHSYTGYGPMLARADVHRLVDFMASIRNPGQGFQDTVPPTIGNPCLARGTKRNVEIWDNPTNTTKIVMKTVVMDGEQIGSFEACNRVVELVMAKDAICKVKPCSFNGVYQPSLLDSFVSGKVLLLFYFFDRIDPLLSSEASTDKLTVSTIASLAKDVCLGREAWITRWGSNSKVMAELEDWPEWCLDLTFMHGLLRLGYEFSDEQEVVIGKKIQDTELGWCLGAAIAMVGGDLKCRTIA